MAAVHYKNYIDKAVAERLAQEQVKPVWTGTPEALGDEERGQYRDDDLCRKIAFLKSAVVVSSEGTNERAVITQARKQGQEVNAVENFKRNSTPPTRRRPTPASPSSSSAICCCPMMNLPSFIPGSIWLRASSTFSVN